MARTVMIDTHIQDVGERQLNDELDVALEYPVSLLIEKIGNALTKLEVTRTDGEDISAADQVTIRTTLEAHIPA